MTTRPLSVHAIMLKATIVLGLPPLPACQTSSQVSRPIWSVLFPRTSGKGPGSLGVGVLQFCWCSPSSAWCDYVPNPGQPSWRVLLALGDRARKHWQGSSLLRHGVLCPTDRGSVSFPIKIAQLIYSFNFPGDVAREKFCQIPLLGFIGDLS